MCHEGLCCLAAVEVDGQALSLGTSKVTPDGLTVAYANTTVEDGRLWAHPGPFTLPMVTLVTDRFAFNAPAWHQTFSAVLAIHLQSKYSRLCIRLSQVQHHGSSAVIDKVMIISLRLGQSM